MCMYGNKGKLLRINLTNRVFYTEEIEEEVYIKYLGGMGLATYYMNKELNGQEDPLSEQNKIFIAVGALTGTIAPTSSRFGLYTKSPATNGFLESYCGGNFGLELKRCGFDLLIIEGKGEGLLYLEIKNNTVKFHSAKSIKEFKSKELIQYSKEKYEGFENLYIGPAGERQAIISSVFSDVRCGGRGGAGAVLGHKNLKAIFIKGTKEVSVSNKELFEQTVTAVSRDLRGSKPLNHLKKYGTSNIIDVLNITEALPNKNYQNKKVDNIENLLPEKISKAFVKNIACHNCPISCSKVSKLKIGEKEYYLDGPEYETIWAFGINCDVYNLDTVIKANILCDEYGVDTISTGNIIAFVMELYQRKIIDKDFLEGIEADWGNSEAVLALAEKICKGEGIGLLLQNGVKNIATELNAGSDFAMQVKGLEMPAFHPSGNYGISLGYAISARGACHLHGAVLSELFGGANRENVKDKTDMVLKNTALCNIINSAILCYFTVNGIGLKEIYYMHKYCTGIEYDGPHELENIGIRIAKMAKEFNAKCGIDKKQDTLPKRVFSNGTDKDKLKNLVNEYNNYIFNF